MELEEILFADRSERGKLRVSGPQAAWFLDQVLTQSFADMVPGETRRAAMITVHGRMTAYLEAHRTDDETFFFHFEPSLRATLPDALRRYLFATRADVDDVTDDYGLVLVVGPDHGRVAEHAAGRYQATGDLGVPAGYVWIEASRAAEAVDALRGAGAREASGDLLEEIRIRNGIPRWGFEMDERSLPQEVGIADDAVHYDKGCYLGQEAMAKIHFRGKPNRRLAVLEASAPIPAGSDVTVNGAKVGRVTSARGPFALAVVRHTVEAGTVVDAGQVQAKVVPPPRAT